MPQWKASLQARTILLVAVILFSMLAAVGISSYLAVQHSIQRALQERLSLAQTTASPTSAVQCGKNTFNR